MRSTRANALYSSIYSVLRLVFPLVTYPYVTRVLGPEGIGVVSYSQSVATLFVQFSLLGLPLYAAREIGRSREFNSTDSTFSSLLTLSIILSGIASVLYFLSPLVRPDIVMDRNLFLLFGIVVIVSFANLDWFFRGVEDFKVVTVRNLITRLLSVVAIFVLIRRADQVFLYGLIWVAGTVTSSGINLGVSFRYARFRLRDAHPIQHLKGVLPSTALAMAGSIYGSIDTVMLGTMLSEGAEAVGYYSLSSRLMRIAMSILVAGNSVLAPRIARHHVSGKSEEIERLLGLNLRFTLFFGLPMVIGLIATAPDVVVVFGGAGFAESFRSTQLLAPQLLMIAVGSVVGVQALYSTGKEWRVFLSVFVSLGVVITLNWILIPRFAQNGAALSTLIARSVELAIQIWFARQLMVGAIRAKGTVKIVLLNVVFAVSIWGLLQVLPDSSAITRMVVVTGSGIVGYAILATVFRIDEWFRALSWVGIKKQK